MADAKDATGKVVYTDGEKQLLASLIKKEKIIEVKRTNKTTNKLKAEAWDRITNRYNNHALVTNRNTEQLKRCWEKSKQVIKEQRIKGLKNKFTTSNRVRPSDPGVDTLESHRKLDLLEGGSPTFFEIKRPSETLETETDRNIQNSNYDLSDHFDSKVEILRAASPLSKRCQLAASNITTLAERRRQIETCTESAPPTSSNTTVKEITEKTPVLPSTMTAQQSASTETTNKLMDIYKERERHDELHTLRRSILKIEQEQAIENLRHHREIHRIKEILEAERLEHQRTLWKIELERADSESL